MPKRFRPNKRKSARDFNGRAGKTKRANVVGGYRGGQRM